MRRQTTGPYDSLACPGAHQDFRMQPYIFPDLCALVSERLFNVEAEHTRL